MDRDRAIILARRARFLAAAVAASGLVESCAREAEPVACLEPPQIVEVDVPAADAASDEPEVGQVPPRQDGGGAHTPPPDPELGPRICLSDDFF